MRRDPKRSRSAQELTSSWLICAWISEKILSQLIVDVVPRDCRDVNFPTRLPQNELRYFAGAASGPPLRTMDAEPWLRLRRSCRCEWR
jgi:hypothetical protein